MARRRSIDPDIWSDDRVLALPTTFAMLLYIGTISQADDEGRLEWSARQLFARLFPARDDVKLRDVEAAMEAVADAGLVSIYRSGPRCYAHHRSWKKYQNVNRPSKSKLPAPPEADETQHLHSLKESVDATVSSSLIQSRSESVNTSLTNAVRPQVPSVSVSVSVSDTGSSEPNGSAVPKRVAPTPRPKVCPCLGSIPLGSDDDPEQHVDLFLGVFANCQSPASRGRHRPVWLGWLREMAAEGFGGEAMWSAFATAHTDAEHAPLRDSRAAWAALRLGRRAERAGMTVDPLPRPSREVLAGGDA